MIGSVGIKTLFDDVADQVPGAGVATLAPGVEAHGLDDGAVFIGDKVGRAQVVGVDERFIRLAVSLKDAADLFFCKHLTSVSVLMLFDLTFLSMVVLTEGPARWQR